ncbi:MAG TPA: SPW repeat protein [Opitutaceae bacterium]|nr:SPW repeat protein [Opitutaceae bacterium]
MNDSDRNKENAISWASGINLFLGVWLFISPWIITYVAAESRWNDLIVGAAVVLFSWIRLVNRGRAGVPSWINLLLGLWLIFAPFVMHYVSNGQRWNSVVVGVIVAVLAITSGAAGATRHHPTAAA